MFKEENHRKRFIENVTEFLLKFEFDGLDIYWYPHPEELLKVLPEDKTNFQLLMTELKVSLAVNIPNYTFFNAFASLS